MRNVNDQFICETCAKCLHVVDLPTPQWDSPWIKKKLTLVNLYKLLEVCARRYDIVIRLVDHFKNDLGKKKITHAHYHYRKNILGRGCVTQFPVAHRWRHKIVTRTESQTNMGLLNAVSRCLTAVNVFKDLDHLIVWYLREFSSNSFKKIWYLFRNFDFSAEVERVIVVVPDIR